MKRRNRLSLSSGPRRKLKTVDSGDDSSANSSVSTSELSSLWRPSIVAERPREVSEITTEDGNDIPAEVREPAVPRTPNVEALDADGCGEDVESNEVMNVENAPTRPYYLRAFLDMLEAVRINFAADWLNTSDRRILDLILDELDEASVRVLARLYGRKPKWLRWNDDIKAKYEGEISDLKGDTSDFAEALVRQNVLQEFEESNCVALVDNLYIGITAPRLSLLHEISCEEGSEANDLVDQMSDLSLCSFELTEDKVERLRTAISTSLTSKKGCCLSEEKQLAFLDSMESLKLDDCEALCVEREADLESWRQSQSSEAQLSQSILDRKVDELDRYEQWDVQADYVDWREILVSLSVSDLRELCTQFSIPPSILSTPTALRSSSPSILKKAAVFVSRMKAEIDESNGKESPTSDGEEERVEEIVARLPTKFRMALRIIETSIVQALSAKKGFFQLSEKKRNEVPRAIWKFASQKYSGLYRLTPSLRRRLVQYELLFTSLLTRSSLSGSSSGGRSDWSTSLAAVYLGRAKWPVYTVYRMDERMGDADRESAFLEATSAAPQHFETMFHKQRFSWPSRRAFREYLSARLLVADPYYGSYEGIIEYAIWYAYANVVHSPAQSSDLQASRLYPYSPLSVYVRKVLYPNLEALQKVSVAVAVQAIYLCLISGADTTHNGYYWERLTIAMRKTPERCLEVCELGLTDPHVRTEYSLSLHRRRISLHKPPVRWTTPAPLPSWLYTDDEGEGERDSPSSNRRKKSVLTESSDANTKDNDSSTVLDPVANNDYDDLDDFVSDISRPAKSTDVSESESGNVPRAGRKPRAVATLLDRSFSVRQFYGSRIGSRTARESKNASDNVDTDTRVYLYAWSLRNMSQRGMPVLVQYRDGNSYGAMSTPRGRKSNRSLYPSFLVPDAFHPPTSDVLLRSCDMDMSDKNTSRADGSGCGGDEQPLTVEQWTLQQYFVSDGMVGSWCEGRLFRTLIYMLLWPCIYCADEMHSTGPGPTVPHDWLSDAFFQRRQEILQHRCRRIMDWSPVRLCEELRGRYRSAAGTLCPGVWWSNGADGPGGEKETGCEGDGEREKESTEATVRICATCSYFLLSKRVPNELSNAEPCESPMCLAQLDDCLLRVYNATVSPSQWQNAERSTAFSATESDTKAQSETEIEGENDNDNDNRSESGSSFVGENDPGGESGRTPPSLYPLSYLQYLALSIGVRTLAKLCWIIALDWKHRSGGLPDLWMVPMRRFSVPLADAWVQKSGRTAEAENCADGKTLVEKSESGRTDVRGGAGVYLHSSVPLESVADAEAILSPVLGDGEGERDGERERDCSGDRDMEETGDGNEEGGNSDDGVSGVVSRSEFERGFSRLFTGSTPCVAAEVKGPGDSLADRQRVWLKVLARAGLKVELALVGEREK